MPFHFTIPNASIQDTLRYILNFVNKYSNDPFVKQFANEFDPSGDKQAYIHRIFDYICKHGYYELDGDGNEELWTPAKIIRERNANGKFKYDCKKITILLGSVLKAAGIDPVLKHVYYSDGAGGFKDYTHIYIIVPESSMRPWGVATTMEFQLQPYITVDPTNNCMWNTEVPHDKATLYFLDGKKIDAPMDLHLMGNNNQNQANKGFASVRTMFNESAGQVESDMNAIVGCPDRGLIAYNNYNAEAIGLKNDYFSFTAAEAAMHVAKVGVYAIPRNAFLGLLYLGKLLANTPLKLNWAARIALAWQKDKARVRKRWWLLGGTASASALQQAVIKGSGIKISGPIGQGYDYPIDLVTSWKNEQRAKGIGIDPATLTAIATATPVVVALLKMLKDMNVVKEGETDPPVPPDTAPPSDPPPPPPAPPGPGFSSFDLIEDLTHGNLFNALVKAVILITAIQMIVA